MPKVPFQGYMSTRVLESSSAESTTATKDGDGRIDSSLSSGRRDRRGRYNQGSQVGQKVITNPIDKQEQDKAKYNLYVLVLKLLDAYIPDYESENYN